MLVEVFVCRRGKRELKKPLKRIARRERPGKG
jgi:hypothetical protein